ncbi:MAG: flavodoxin family protein [Bacillota bacterium]
MVKLLGISGSPRKASTEYAVKEALGAAGAVGGVETAYLSLRGKKLNFCLHCDHCLRERGVCVHKDDMPGIMAAVSSADGLIVGSPVYEGSMSGQLKTMFDRMRPWYMLVPHPLPNKVGGALAVGGDRHGGQETTVASILQFMLIYEFIVVGGKFPNGNYGGTVWSRDIVPEGTSQDEEGLRTIRGLGRRVAEVAKLVVAARAASS